MRAFVGQMSVESSTQSYISFTDAGQSLRAILANPATRKQKHLYCKKSFAVFSAVSTVALVVWYAP
jgi:hypothetical protein